MATNHVPALFASAVTMGHGESGSGLGTNSKRSFASGMRLFENINPEFLRFSLWKTLFWIWLLGSGLSSGTVPPAAFGFAGNQSSGQSFLFISPNTREHMSDEAAWESLDSFEQRNFVAVENYLATRLCSKPEVVSAEGMDGSTTENSTLVTGCNAGRARYLGELLARYAHQKWIFIFDPVSGGSERLLIVSFFAGHPAEMPKLLRQQGLTAATVVVKDKLVQVYLWLKDHSQDTAAAAFVQAVHGTVQELKGKATFTGSDSRAAAQPIFDREIQIYERAHHQSFSKLLGSRSLHDLGLNSSH